MTIKPIKDAARVTLEITPAMVEAGKKVLYDEPSVFAGHFGVDCDAGELVTQVYLAMSRLRPLTPGSRYENERPYRALTDGGKVLHDAIKTMAAELEALFGQVETGRYASLVMTLLVDKDS